MAADVLHTEEKSQHMRLLLPDTVTHSELTPSDTPTSSCRGRGDLRQLPAASAFTAQTPRCLSRVFGFCEQSGFFRGR